MNSKWNRSTGAVLAAVAVALAPAAALAGPNGNVLSSNLRDADGTTGQDSTRGAGVKTPHIQNGAVTAPKLATGAVGTAAIADGAVTSAKLGGLVPASKIDRTGLDADSIDGYQAADFSPIMHDHVPAEIQGLDAFRRKQGNVLVVALDGSGDYQTPREALAAAAAVAAHDRTFLVKLAPGTYDVGATTLVVPRYVVLEGSGAEVTTLIGHTLGSTDGKTACVKVDNSALRFLSVYCEPTFPAPDGAWATGVFSVAASLDFVNVQVQVQNGFGVVHEGFTTQINHSRIQIGGGAYNVGVYCSFVNCAARVQDSLVFTGGTALGTGIGVRLDYYGTVEIFDSMVQSISAPGATAYGVMAGYLSKIAVRNSRVVAIVDQGTAVGVYSANGDVKLEGSLLEATTPALSDRSAPTYPIRIGNTQIAGAGAIGAGVKCLGTYSDSFDAVSCPR